MRIASAFVAIACGLLAWTAYATYAHDRDARVPAARFAEQFTLNVRRPDVATSLGFAPSADFAMDLIADATLRDVTAPAQLRGLPPETRLAWIDAVGRYDDQIARAIEFTLDAAAERPGWPYHTALLGQLVYAGRSRSLSPEVFTRSDQWKRPLEIATAATPHDPLLWQFMAVAYLQTWPALERQHRQSAPVVFAHAFDDVDFVRGTFASAAQVLGADAAIGSLPESPKPLWAAFDQLAKSGDMQSAWLVHERWDAAEWKQRQIDLALIEKAATRRDVDTVRFRCEQWARAHSVWDYDSPEAHAQAAKLLELWPASDDGKWPNDTRAEVIRYFLSGRRDGVDGALLVRAADIVDGVPAPTQAQLHVLAADIAGAESIAKRSESFGSFEWKPYLFELARYWTRKGDRQKAQAAIAALPPAAREECEARTLRDDADASATAVVSLTWSDRADVALCHATREGARLTLTVLSDTPAVVDYGFDGARTGSLFLPRKGTAIELTLPPFAGQRNITLRAPSQKDGSIATQVQPVAM